MKQLILNTKRDLCAFNIYEWAILLSCLGLFLPFQYAAAVIAVMLLFFLFKGKLIPALRQQKGKGFLYGFIILEAIICLFYKNTIGLINTAGYLLIGLFIAVYRRYLTPKLFQYILETMILMSWLAALWGLIEFNRVSTRSGYAFFDFVIQNKPKDRINSTFTNANFYATMCDFFILFCLYEYVNNRRIGHRIYYVITSLLNLFMLLLTGCRTALLPFLVIFPIFFGLARKRKLFILSIGMELSALILLLVFPHIIPRAGEMSTLYSRFKIWMGALTLIAMNPLFGRGPQTYGLMYKQMHFHKAPHAHNLLLESLTSYGLVGTYLVCRYFWVLIKEALSIYGRNRYSSQFALIICFFVTACILGLLDFTLNFLVTGTTFMMVVNSAGMYVNSPVHSTQNKLQ